MVVMPLNMILHTLCLALTSSILLAAPATADDNAASNSVDYTAVYDDYQPGSGSLASTLPAAEVLAKNDPYPRRSAIEDPSPGAIATVLNAPAAKARGFWIDPFQGIHASGRFGKRETQYLNDLSRRLRDMYVEYKKRQNAFQFGLGKRSGGSGMSSFSFGLGKRSGAGADNDFLESVAERLEKDRDDAPAANDGQDVIYPSKRSPSHQRFAFGLGKRAGAKAFAFGLGKRPMPEKQQFSFGLGKRAAAAPFAFGLGKRARQSPFQFGLGKRGSSERFAFGLGKRSYLSLEDDINDSVPVGDYLPSPEVNSDDAGGLVHEIPRYFDSPRQDSSLHQPVLKMASFRFGLGKRSIDQKQAQLEREREQTHKLAETRTNEAVATKNTPKTDSPYRDTSKPEILQF